MRLRLKALRSAALSALSLLLAGGMALGPGLAGAASQADQPTPLWGAIATVDGLYGYAFNHPTQAAHCRADCRLRYAQAQGGAAGTGFVVQRFENFQQVEVNVSDIHLAHIIQQWAGLYS